MHCISIQILEVTYALYFRTDGVDVWIIVKRPECPCLYASHARTTSPPHQIRPPSEVEAKAGPHPG